MTEEEKRKARGKEIHRRVMIVLGALIAASGLAAWHVGRGGAAFLQPVMFGRWRGRPALDIPAIRRPSPSLTRWRPFDAAAQAEARAAGKLLLLSVVAPWSGPCRLMDERAYADPEIADFLAQQVVAVRVDAEARPDLALRYLGRGWPTTALLLPSGRVVEAGTYMEAALFKTWAEAVAAAYAKKRDAVAAALERAKDASESSPAARGPGETLDWARARLASPPAGAAVFPGFDRLDDLLGGVPEPWSVETATLTLARSRRLEDPEWGGFYRDSRSADFTRAEREKLLEDQAAAVSVLARLARVDEARRTLDYVERFLEDPKGGYYSSQAGEADLKDGTVESGDSYFAKIDRARRAAGAPPVDKRSLASENGAMARAVLTAGKVARPRDLAYARKVLERWWRSAVRGGRVARELSGAGPRGLLDDQVSLARAYLAAGRVDRAAELLASCEKDLFDEKTGAFFDRKATGELPPDLDRLLVAPLEYRAWRAYLELSAALPAGPRRARARARAEELRNWLWEHRGRLDAARLAVAARAGL